MNRLLLKSFLSLTLVFTLLVGLIHAQPHTDASLRALLLPPEGCPAPCWQGIRPGVTRLNAASGIMEADGGIEAVERPARFSGQLDSSPVTVALLTHPGARDPNPIVELVRLRLTDTTFGAIQLALGQPDRVVAYGVPEHGYTPFVVAYSRYNLFVLVDMPACDVEQTTLWNTTRYVDIFYGDWLDYDADYYLSSTELNVDTWASELRDVLHCDNHGFEWAETVISMSSAGPNAP